MKTLTYATLIAIAVVLFPNRIWAQDEKDENQKTKQENVDTAKVTQRGINFVDANKNGICDRFENAKPLGNGPNFIDSDKNGICDNRENGKRGNGNGYGYQHRNGQRQGQGWGRGPCGGKGWKNR